jgi:hypothetical protein
MSVLRKFSPLPVLAAAWFVFAGGPPPEQDSPERLISERLAALPAGAVSARQSFVIASEGESYLFNPAAGVWRAPFLPGVFRAFGFSSDSRYFLYLKSQGRLPGFSLYCYDLAERADRPVSHDSVHYAQWSPVSLQAAYISLESASRFHLRLYDLISNSTREVFSGALDPEYLEWSADGRKLYFVTVEPQAAGAFDEQTYTRTVREYDVYGARAGRRFPDRWGPYAPESLPGSDSRARQTAGRPGALQGRSPQRLAVNGDRTYATVLEGGELRTYRRYAGSDSWELLGAGEIHWVTADGVLLRRFGEGGVAYRYVNDRAQASSEVFESSEVFKLPYQGSAYLVQGGQSYTGGACDGTACMVIAHKNLLGYGLDFQQTSEEGQGNQHMLAVADGTVVATENNITCNSARTSCVVGWDDYSPTCTSAGGAGNYVVVAHADGTYSLYAHLKSGSVQVTAGQTVRQGQFLAVQGHSGSANSPTGYRNCGDHLHFQRQTGPAVWSQSVPTNFLELPCTPSCMTAHVSANVELNPGPAGQLTLALAPASVIGSLTTTANRVLLPAAAPAGGATVALSSTDPGRAAVPASVVVPAGSTGATFPLQVNGDVTVTTTVTIRATYGGTTASAALSVVPPKLTLIQLRTSAVTGGAAVTGNDVALSGYASRDVAVALVSSKPAALSVPQSVTVPAGSSAAKFDLQTYPVATDTQATVTASAGGGSKTAYLTVKAGGTPVVTVSVSPKTVTLLAGRSQAFTATVSGTTNTAVTWSISPAVGSISSSGLYTAPPTLTATTTVKVRATSVADPTKYDEATVTLNPPPPPPPPGGVLFADDFASGSLANWTIVDEGTIDKPSNWQVSGGVLYQKSNIYGGDGTGLPAPGTYALTGQASWSNYSVSVRVQSTDNDGIGVMFGYKDSKNYYRFWMDQQRSYRRLIKMVNGTATLLAEDKVAYQQGRWYALEARMANGAIEIRIDGTTLFQVTDSTHSSGKIALYSWCNIGAQYDDVQVTAVAP